MTEERARGRERKRKTPSSDHVGVNLTRAVVPSARGVMRV